MEMTAKKQRTEFALTIDLTNKEEYAQQKRIVKDKLCKGADDHQDMLQGAALMILERAARNKAGYTGKIIGKMATARARVKKIDRPAAKIEVLAEIDAEIATAWTHDDAKGVLGNIKSAGSGGLHGQRGYLNQAKRVHLFGSSSSGKRPDAALQVREHKMKSFDEVAFEIAGPQGEVIAWDDILQIAGQIGGKNTEKIQKAIMAVISGKVTMTEARKSVGLKSDTFSKACEKIGLALLGRRRQTLKKVHTNRGKKMNKQLGLDLAA
jgi:hypothetical protein